MQNISELVRSLGLEDGTYIVVGGGVLTALGIRDLHDIDLLVTPDVFLQLQIAGWPQASWMGKKGLRQGIFEVGTDVRGYTLPELLHEAVGIEGVTYLTLELVYAIKKRLDREEDRQDVALIELYRTWGSWSEENFSRAAAIVARMYEN